MKIEETLNSLRDRIHPPRSGRLGNAFKVAAGTAAAIWVVLQLRRELYGPGGSRMSRYDPDVDEIWEKEEAERREDEAAEARRRRRRGR